MEKKRLIFAALFLVIVIGLGFLMYRVFFGKKEGREPRPISERGEGVVTEFPTVGEGVRRVPGEERAEALPGAEVRREERQVARPEPQTKALISQPSDVAAKSPGTSGGGVNFYNAQDSKFYRIRADGSLQPLSDKVFFNVDKATWSPSKNETIIEYPDGSNIYYNFDTKRQVTLPKHWEDFGFSPQGDKIAAKSITIAPENRWLTTSNPDGSDVKLIEALGNNADKVTINWSPNKQVVALSTTGEALGSDRQEVLLVGLNRENFKSLVVEGRGLEAQWSPQGKKLLYSVYSARNEYKPSLWIVNAEGDSIGANRRLLNLETWANKCTMVDERFAYCGVPERLDVGAGFAPSISDSTPDKLFKIDTVTGLKTEIALDDLHVIDNIFVSQDGKTLSFTDKSQTGIFQIPIK